MRKIMMVAATMAALLGGCAAMPGEPSTARGPYGGSSLGSSMGAPTGARSAGAMGTVVVGGATMYPGRDIIDNAANSKDHTTLVAGLRAAGLAGALKSAGPFTVFAPTNAAFDRLAPGMLDGLMRRGNKAVLEHVLASHVVAGRLDGEALARMVQAGAGRAWLTTLSGARLSVVMRAGVVVVGDEQGGMAAVSIANVYQSNGVIHVVDKVLLPR